MYHLPTVRFVKQFAYLYDVVDSLFFAHGTMSFYHICKCWPVDVCHCIEDASKVVKDTFFYHWHMTITLFIKVFKKSRFCKESFTHLFSSITEIASCVFSNERVFIWLELTLVDAELFQCNIFPWIVSVRRVGFGTIYASESALVHSFFENRVETVFKFGSWWQHRLRVLAKQFWHYYILYKGICPH